MGKGSCHSSLHSGVKVIGDILSKARHLYSNGYDNVFLKSGGIKQAERDFYSVVSPDEAKTINMVCMSITVQLLHILYLRMSIDV